MKKLYKGVALEDLGWDIDEMADLPGFFEWVTYDPEIDEAVWNEEEGYWEYPDDYDYDDDYDDEDYWDRYWEEIEELSEMHEKLEKCVERINKK